MKAAKVALRNAHAPYSGYRSGAALRLDNGAVFSGCTVENPAYAQGCDAIETAAGTMIGAGWVESGKLPVIEEVAVCYEKLDEKYGWLPGQGGRALLEIFGTPETLIHFATSTETIVKSLFLQDLVTGTPEDFLGRSEYSQTALARLEKESLPATEFRKPPLDKLHSVRLQAFCPVSHYAVGSMVETGDGQYFYGCNVEYGTNTCLHAENNAIAAMVSALGPQTRIRSVHVLTAGNPGFPCGDCRQRIYEFALPDTEIVAMNTDGKQERVSFKKLFPHAFGRADLESVQSDEAA
jgi:cytidine deaminase